MSFANLGLSEALVRAVADAGYTQPTPIQQQAIPEVLRGADLMAGAQTGTGKTAAFLLPILQRLESAPPPAGPRRIRVLVLAPTRELAAQILESARVYGKHSDVRAISVFGGVSIRPQIEDLRKGVDILVATPGRLLDHVGQKTVDLSHVEVLVLDEADRMLDMGFLPDIRRVLAALPRNRQNLLFSATFADEVRELARSLLREPVHIQVTPRNTTVEKIAQTVHPVDAKRKAELLIHLIQEGNWFQVLVFTRTKHGANRLALRLERAGIPALPIHGNKSQNARTRALAEFKTGKLQVLVATDIAARGLDIEQLPHVVNFDLPTVPEDYVHRIGRTGRAGADGEAISLVSSDENPLLRDIERLTRQQIPRRPVAGFEPGSAPPEHHAQADADVEATVSARRSGPRRGGGQRPSSGAPRTGAPRGGSAPAHRSSGTGRPTSSNGTGRSPSSAGGGQGRSSTEGGRAPSSSGAGRGSSSAESARAPSTGGAGRASHAGEGQRRPPRPATDARGGHAAEGERNRGRGRASPDANSLVRSNLPPGFAAAPANPRRPR